jgi:hypothetical protein
MRYSSIGKDHLKDYVPGAVIEFKGFTSTTKSFSHIRLMKNYYHFRIQGRKAGRDIEMISGIDGEREVLFKAGTKFRVLDRQADPNRCINCENFVLEEVTD